MGKLHICPVACCYIGVSGAGQGGLPAAHMAANLGAKVALIEMREVGVDLHTSTQGVRARV